MCVMPAIGTLRLALACCRNAFSIASRACWICAAASMTNKRKSVATSSLRLRPVCNFQPSGPSSSTSAFSTKWCTSSALAPKRSSHTTSVFARSAILSSAARVCFTSAAVRMPIGSSALAQARSTIISYGRKRRSNANDRWNASKRSLGSRSKRPPHSRSSLRSVIGRFLDELRFAALGFCFWPDGYGQRKQIDEALGVLGVVAAHRETGEVRAIKREGRNTLGDVERALPKFEADSAGDALLRDIEESVERFAQRRKPQAVVNQLGVAQRECLLEMRGLAVDCQALEFLMRFDEQRSAGSFVRAAGFHSDEAIFDEVGAADAMSRCNFIELVEKIDRTELRAVHGDGGARLESDFDFLGFVRSFFGRNDPLPHRFVRSVGGIFEFAAFVAEVPDVAVAAVDIFLALLDVHVVLLRVGDGGFARVNVPLAPRCDDLNVRRDGFVSEFKSHLIVAFSGAAVGEAIGAEFQRDFRLALGDDGPRHRSAEEIGVFVAGAGAQGRPDIIADKFFAQILDVRRGSAGGERFLARGFEIFLLADVADDGDDFAAVIFLEPRDDDGGVESS